MVFFPIKLVLVQQNKHITQIYRLRIFATFLLLQEIPLGASVTLLEATTPVKLPTKQCPRFRELEAKCAKARISTATPR